MNRKSIFKDNKGATLILIIVAMMFVGIIASIVLTLTVGNNKSAKATIDTSENFYSSESVLDDLNMYLKKIGTTAATEAYALTLAECSDPSTMQEYFETKYKEKLAAVLGTQILDIYADDIIDGKHVFDTDFVRNQITFAEENELIKNGIASIKYKKFDTTGTYAKLEGVEISYIDERGYENIITTNITFKVNLPTTQILGSSSPFSYPIDHFVMMSGGTINPSNTLLAQTIKGNLYAYENINVKTKTSSDLDATASDWVKIYCQYVLSGKNINVNGRLSVAPIHLAGFEDAAEVWCDNIYLVAKNAEVVTGDSTQSFDTDVYLKGNLELNGKEASYTATKGDFYGYSKSSATYYNPTTDTEKPESSAIILNGLGAKLNMSGLTSLNIAGTAYSALPDPSGKVDVYSYYNGYTNVEPTNVYYYSQGDSVTVRSLQALYLIPGDFIKGVGHNPMKKSEFESIDKDNIEIPTALVKDGENYLINTGTVYKTHYVQYAGGDQYVYLFWDFVDTNSAVKYFNKASSGRYSELFKKQMGALGEAHGEIKLPSNTSTTGYSVTYDSSATTPFGIKSSGSLNIGSLEDKYDGLMTTLTSTKSGTNVIKNMFGDFDGEHSKYAGYGFEGTMAGPYEGFILGDGTTYTYAKNDTNPTYAYKIITGQNVQLGNVGGHVGDSNWVVEPHGDYTYIIVTPGDVDLRTSGTFRGMIIAGGNISMNSGLNMECLGMVSRTETRVDSEGNTTTTEQNITEFQALLGIAPNETNLDNPNSRFREIFGVRDGSFDVGGEDGSKFVDNIIDEWARN